MRKSLYILLVMFSIMLVAAGCGQSDSESSGSGDSNESAEATEETEQEEEKLAPEDVIINSSEAMQDWPGMEYSSNTQQNMTVTQGDQEESFDQEMTMDARMTLDPMTMEMSGETTMQDMQMPLETYYVDDVMYSQTQGQWIGIEGMNLDQFTEQSQGQNPAQQMEQMMAIFEELPESEDDSDYISMTEENNEYVVELNLNEEASAEIMDIAMEQLEGTMGQQLQQMGAENALQDMQIKNMNQTYYVDKESFEQSKIEQQMEIEMPIEDVTMSIDMDMTTEIAGKVEEEITVPDDVKNNAQVISLEELQQMEQGQNQDQDQQGQNESQ
ncbi:DUF6612 family protein [Lentibacillus sp. CBA3610]|uniref:DUF6612 family protein n=1 Tax=Lentibacillus sp. CBA3610 TaxID=2518176 RepID=UPI00159633AF|nr:DUF6612 family protein [Lentibacillus sp. CBA3610]QKY68387.1 hypothetical protein Len3610_00990 [Lentibacillus sp. CBA3610]